MLSVGYDKKDSPLMDVDLDLCPSRRPIIIKKIKEERGKNFLPSIDPLSRKNLGCTLIATFGTQTSKSAVLCACRGYRSEEFPDGIDSDTAQYLASLIPVERGFVWPLSDVINGNEDKDRKPILSFVSEAKKYPRLLEIALGVEGLIDKRSSHASGVIFTDEDPYEFACFMRTPKGEVITQWDLHQVEWAGHTKYDFLLTDVEDKLRTCIKLLQANEKIDSSLTLRQTYDKHFHPGKLPIDSSKLWDAVNRGNILNFFQFDSEVGSQAIKKVKPDTITSLGDCNGLMRLMTAEKGQETPMDKYARFKNNINLWYQEMDREGLTKQEQKTLEPYFLSSYGVPPSQEQLMLMLMDKDICGFTLKESNAARRTVAKKKMSEIPALKQKILERAASSALGEYVWKYGVGPQMGYSFSVLEKWRSHT